MDDIYIRDTRIKRRIEPEMRSRVEEGDGAIAFAIPAEGRRKRFITWP
jgi:hypothetical protein